MPNTKTKQNAESFTSSTIRSLARHIGRHKSVNHKPGNRMSSRLKSTSRKLKVKEFHIRPFIQTVPISQVELHKLFVHSRESVALCRPTGVGYASICPFNSISRYFFSFLSVLENHSQNLDDGKLSYIQLHLPLKSDEVT